MGNLPGSVIGVVKGGRVGIPGIVGGVGAGIVIPVNMGGAAAAEVGPVEDSIVASLPISSLAVEESKSISPSAGGGPNMA